MEIVITGSAFEYLPVELVYGVFTNESGDVLCVIPKEFPFHDGWGKYRTFAIEESNTIWPYAIDLVWLSVSEERLYHYKGLFPYLPTSLGCEDDSYITIIVGMSSHGRVAFWVSNYSTCILLQWIKGEDIDIPPSNFRTISKGRNLHEVCSNIMNGIPTEKDWDKLITKRMIQYAYRLCFDFSRITDEMKKKDMHLDEIKVERFDSTYEKSNIGTLLNYHIAGKPNKIAVSWSIKDIKYQGFFWMDEVQTNYMFDKLYGAHPETKTDFIISIDAENKKYELALYRQGLKEPVVIPESAYQLIVFKNKFEDYRSENYNQPRGAWIW